MSTPGPCIGPTEVRPVTRVPTRTRGILTRACSRSNVVVVTAGARRRQVEGPPSQDPRIPAHQGHSMLTMRSSTVPPLPRGLVVPVAPARRVVPALLQGLRARVVATGAWVVARRSRYRTTRHTLKARIVRQELLAATRTRRSCRCFGRRRYFRTCPERQVWISSRSSRRSSRNAPRETSAHGEGSEAHQGHKR